VANGHLRLPIVPGDLYGDNGSAQMVLQQSLPGSWVATAKVKHAAIDSDGEAAGLALVNSLDPNNFVKTAVQYKSDTDPDTAGAQPGKWAERVVTSNGSAVTIPPATVPWPNSGALSTAGDYIWVRFVYDAQANEVTTWTSTDGTTFASFGAPIGVSQYLGAPGGFRVGLFAKHDGGENGVVEIDAFNVVVGSSDPQTRGDDCGGAGGGCPQVDQFDGTALDPKWEVVNPTPENLAVGGGNLTLTSGIGDVRNTSFNAPNILLQQVPEGPWTATVKLDHTAVAHNGQAAGMVIYGSQDPNYFAKSAIQYKDNDLSGNPMNGIWAERALTLDGSTSGDYGGQFPNTGKLTPPTDALWLRTSFDGTNVITEYSYDGTTFAATAPPFPASVLGAGGVTKLGLFVKHDGRGEPAAVKFDSFTVEAQSCGGQDSSPPRTTHVLDPASPNGDGGYYDSDVKVTLDAADNDGGSGVDHTEYREAGAEEWTAYSAPFDVTSDGSHTIEYRSVDKEGNVESTRSVTIKIDKTGPSTSAKLNGEAPKANYDGDVAVDLDATDGTSGVNATEIRVDGGEWQPYVEEETILNSAADLAKWEQAGPGGLTWIDEDGGFARPHGGLGMPWYPVKDYGDFSLKFQWRDSSTGSSGNGGAFVRFPNPAEAVTRAAADRYPCQVGSAQSSPAWVAIYCGHEIQINDHQSDPQKTGSIYNFSPLDATQAKVQPRGTWVDYEIKVVGQTFTIIRNGEVLQTFENSPGQTSSRAGDPSTTDRQFMRGYIGLQNHSDADVIDYRNVRVLPLDAGSARGPVTVSGDGAHTVEFRSTDVAGNVEETKTVEFTIGGGGDTTAPVTTSTLNPASPGAGGTYDGPVNIELSATDPATPGGGGEPKTVDTDAAPDHWEPNQLDATVGDTVRWNFPTTAGTVHDVWIIKPGEGPTSDGTQLSDIVLPGGDPVTTTVDAAGSWTFLCKVHSHKEQDGWQGMVGTVDVAEGGGDETPGSGVDYTEYRVNTDGATGEWVRKDNADSESPFVTAFSVMAEGSHVVEYRSHDKAGNTEAIKSVAFTIAEPAVSDSDDVDVTADVPLVMSIELGGPVTFGSMVPGEAHDYTASTTATVTSSSPSSSLSVVDPSATAPGHLLNGTVAMPQPLQAAAGGPFAPIGGTPTILRSWTDGLANEPVGIEFKQSVAATDRLIAGRYGKRITFTLSTTVP
jgi:plastocyanin